MELETYIQYHETKIHEQPDFAYNTYLCTIPDDFKRVPLHWHEQMEIIYIKKGPGIVSVNMKPYTVSAGYVLPILPGELHSIESIPGQKMEYENIIFSLNILDNLEQNDWCRTNILHPLRSESFFFERPVLPGTSFHDEVSGALDRADDACRVRTDGYTLLVKSSLFLFLYALYKYRSTAELPRDSSYSETIKTVIQYVKDNYQRPITVEEISELTDYSESHFMRIFRRETGQTFISFLNDYRLEMAAYLLKETADPVNAIAENTGFGNFSYFIRMFQKKYGTSPLKYRRQR